ncbi:putative transposase DNA-binding domain protein [compost metagenome]
MDSQGNEVDNPKFLRQSEKKLRRYQQTLSRKRKGSANRKKALAKVQKLHEHIANQRRDFLHKQANRLAKTYAVICIEDLNIRGMKRNRKLAKSIHDVGWGMFKQFLKYKTLRDGGLLVLVKPHYTTINCSGCSNPVRKTLSVRTHVCPKCGLVLDRDHNAAINIENAGLALL